MAFRIRWDRLDDTAAACIRASLNAHIRSAMQSGPIQDFEVMHLGFGHNEPYLELVELGPSALAPLHFTGPSEDQLLLRDPMHAEAPWWKNTDHNGGSNMLAPPFALAAVTSDAKGDNPSEPVSVAPSTASDMVARGTHGNSFAAAAFSPDHALDAAGPTVLTSHSYAEDPVSQLLGPDGLSIKLKLSYGGGLELAGRMNAKQKVVLSDTCELEAALPLRFSVSQLAIDTLITIDIHGGVARIWLEPSGSEQESPLSQLDIAVMIGDDDEDVDTCHIATLLQRELQQLLKAAICFPNAVEIPLGAK